MNNAIWNIDYKIPCIHSKKTFLTAIAFVKCNESLVFTKSITALGSYWHKSSKK